MSDLLDTRNVEMFDVIDAQSTVIAFYVGERSSLRALNKDLAEQLELDKQREELSEMEKKALSSLEALNAEAAAHNRTKKNVQKSQDTIARLEQDLITMREELGKAQAEVGIFCNEINGNQGDAVQKFELMAAENTKLREIIRKLRIYIPRVEDNFSEDPDKSLRALDSAAKLIQQVPND